MQFSLETKTYSLGELLSGPHTFRIPAFQRPYAWTDDVVAQLFDDIQAAADRPGQTFFLGPIIASNTNIIRPFDIIDGQQRLVSVTLVIAVLRDLISDEDFTDALQGNLWRKENPASRWSSEPRIKLRECDQAFYEHILRERNSTQSRTENIANNNLYAAITRIREDLASGDQYLKEICGYLLESCYVLLINTKNIEDGYTLFRSINTSGQPLTDLDLARGHVVAANPQLAAIWDDIARSISEEELRAYIYSVASYVDPDLDGLDLNIAIRDILRNPLLEGRFRQSLTALLKSYQMIADGDLGFRQGGPTINLILKYLKALPFENWKPITLTWLSQSSDPTHTLHFLRAMDVLCTGMVILGYVSNTIIKRFQRIRVRIESGSVLSDPSSEIYLTNAEKDKIRENLSNPINPKARFLPYVMLRLNAAMLDSTFVADVKLNVEIEHVLPQTPSPRSVWFDNFKDNHRRILLCKLLGNLAILSKPINIKARNFDFHRKRAEMFGMANSNTFPITADLVNYDAWTEKEILKRHRKLLDVAERVMNPQIMP